VACDDRVRVPAAVRRREQRALVGPAGKRWLCEPDEVDEGSQADMARLLAADVEKRAVLGRCMRAARYPATVSTM
jgi:hypothetical protein